MTLKTNGPRFNPHLLNVPLYIGGKSIEEIKAQFGFEEVVKLASNESPIGPSPLAVEAARQMLSEAHRYPGITELALRRKLAARLGAGLDEGNIVIGNGGTDILRLITQAFVFEGGNTIMCRTTFPMYHIFTTMFGGAPRPVNLRPDYRHDLAAMATQIDNDTRLVYLCSPNNPTGDIITQAEADEFLAGVPDHVVVIFDESYADFVTDAAYPDTIAYVKEGRNVLVVRSFSKYAGLANLRVGYVIGRTELADYLQHTQSPFHTGAIALAAAAASLDDTAYHIRHREVVLAEQAYLYTALDELGLKYLPSQSNFVTFIDPPLAPTTLAEQLLWQGIIVRPMAGFGLPNGIRVTVGSHEENMKFIEALRTILVAQAVLEKAI
jgi:histidinol-phosphate aminotransferase